MHFIILKKFLHEEITVWKEGDFITAPNISNIFSEMIFVWLLSYWEKFYKNKNKYY